MTKPAHTSLSKQSKDRGLVCPLTDFFVAKRAWSIRLMARAIHKVVKGRTRSVLDYRELSQFISSHTGDAAACDETS